MDAVSVLIEMLRAKKMITPLEKDILDTWNELHKIPFSMKSAERQVAMNDANHKDIFDKIAALPTTIPKPRCAINEDDIRYNLTNQLSMLAEKELRELKSQIKAERVWEQ